MQFPFKFNRIDEEEVQKLLTGLDINNTPAWVKWFLVVNTKNTVVVLAIILSLTSVFNYSLQKGQVADELKLVRVR